MTEQTELAIRQESYLMPAMSIQEAISRRNAVVQLVGAMMVEGRDFGKIPNAGDKPTLLKPGAEKLTTFFGLTPRFETVEKAEDWTGEQHMGEPFFYYRIRCSLYRGDRLVAEAEGSCNSWEKKYRYRGGGRACPKCGKDTIRKGKGDRGGWYCWAKLGGCGATFKDGDAIIEKQETGQVHNPDPAEQVNTILKMAQKRAYIAATLLAVNASEFFTQDLEDLDIIDVPVVRVEPQPVKAEPSPTVGERVLAQAPPKDGDGHDGDKRKPAAIKTPAWRERAIALAQAEPHYQKPDGGPNFSHMANAAAMFVSEITDANLDQLIADLSTHAHERERTAAVEAGQQELPL